MISTGDRVLVKLSGGRIVEATVKAIKAISRETSTSALDYLPEMNERGLILPKIHL